MNDHYLALLEILCIDNGLFFYVTIDGDVVVAVDLDYPEGHPNTFYPVVLLAECPEQAFYRLAKLLSDC